MSSFMESQRIIDECSKDILRYDAGAVSSNDVDALYSLLVRRGGSFVDLCGKITNRSSSLSERSAISGVPDPQRLAQMAMKDANRAIALRPFEAAAFMVKGDALCATEQYRNAKFNYQYGLTHVKGGENAGSVGPSPADQEEEIVTSLVDRIKKVAAILNATTTGAGNAGGTANAQSPGGGAENAAAAPVCTTATTSTLAIDCDTDDLNCSLCFKLLYEPVTIACGHTFCRRCLRRCLDHSNRCPQCRVVLFLSPGNENVNRVLHHLIANNLGDAYRARRQEIQAEEELRRSADDANSRVLMPLFVMDSIMPRQRIALNIFEPRYRLLIRRAMGGSRTFGMVGVSANGRTRGGMGPGNQVTEVNPVGCEAEIVECDCLPDGRFHIEIVGGRRFNVHSVTDQDGYRLASISFFNDAPPEETVGGDNSNAREDRGQRQVERQDENDDDDEEDEDEDDDDDDDDDDGDDDDDNQQADDNGMQAATAVPESASGVEALIGLADEVYSLAEAWIESFTNRSTPLINNPSERTRFLEILSRAGKKPELPSLRPPSAGTPVAASSIDVSVATRHCEEISFWVANLLSLINCCDSYQMITISNTRERLNHLKRILGGHPSRQQTTNMSCSVQ